MELEMLRDRMKNILRESRYKHSLGVEEVAYDLALLNGYDTEKASIAGILHDCAKCLTDEQLLKECEKYCLPVKEIELLNRQLLHAKLGAVYAEKIYGVKDQEILDSITFEDSVAIALSIVFEVLMSAFSDAFSEHTVSIKIIVIINTDMYPIILYLILLFLPLILFRLILLGLSFVLIFIFFILYTSPRNNLKYTKHYEFVN
jgi:predicted HD superfamily hydrolase involved in NAD metabolism